MAGPNGRSSLRRKIQVRTAAVLWEAGVASFCALLSLPAVLNQVKPLVETRFSPTPLSDGDAVAGIVVLGGGNSRRIGEGVKLAQRFPHARVLLSGPSPYEVDLSSLAGLGSRLTIDMQSTSTFENAKYSKAIAHPQPGERWILVTSAVHMPRAMSTFFAAGFAVEPWPVSYANLERRYQTLALARELGAMLQYWFLGYTDVLFPRPDEFARDHRAVALPRAKLLHG